MQAGSSIEPIIWKGTKEQFAVLVDELANNNLIDKQKYWKLFETYFCDEKGKKFSQLQSKADIVQKEGISDKRPKLKEIKTIIAKVKST